MAQAKVAKQLTITAPDKVGMLEELSNLITAQGVNIEAICAYGMEGKAVFYVITNNNAKVKQAISSKGWQLKETDVVIAGLENKPGALNKLAAMIKAKNINIKYCYGAACSCSCPCSFVICADNNDALLAAIK
ncbi:MAG: hypothetical protein PHI86_02500 [Candidatus Omnitrophica bacterium]|nr:hypothetical protein [Candidatus Omnitrophota bacterium]HOX55076.1 hypothetical protein [Candidatus Omnitrophota bacterium]